MTKINPLTESLYLPTNHFPLSTPLIQPVNSSSYSLVVNDNGDFQAITNSSPSFRVGLFESTRRIENLQDPNLEAALTSISEENIRKDLGYIAADERGGRDTPSEGLTQTAEYLKARLIEHGWQPGASANSYLYPYRLWGFGQFKISPDDLLEGDTSLLPRTNHAEITELTLEHGRTTANLAYGEDYFYTQLSGNHNAKITGELINVGFGFAEYFEDMHQKFNLKDKWVVCLDSSKVSPHERRELAKKYGAKGLIVLPNPKESSGYLAQKLSHYSHLAKEGELPIRFDEGLNEIYLTENGAAKFLPFLNQTFLTQRRSFLPFLPQPTKEVTVTDKRVLRNPFTAVEADNVIGFWEGSDPELKKEVIIISAHYDHVGKKWGRIYNGADDNGSGTVALLQLIEAIKIRNPERSIMIMWLSGEEKGLLGSAAWAKNPYFPEGFKPILNINVDMVGRNADDHMLITPTKKHRAYNGLTPIAMKIAPLEGITTIESADPYHYRTDSAEIGKVNGGIPTVFVTSGLHDDYHQPSDTAEKINYNKLWRNTRWVLRIVNALQADELDL